MQFHEFKNKLENKIKPDINGSYYENNKWKTSRCRIDVYFWCELIFDVITRKINKCTMNDINEEYLRKTRNISMNDYEYKNSKNMDINAICKWFNINKEFYLEIGMNVNAQIYIEYIKKYMNEKFEFRNYQDIFSSEWNLLCKDGKYSSVLTPYKNYVDAQNIISDICNNKKWKLVSANDWKPNIIRNNKLIINNDINNKSINDLEIIGKSGEQIVYEYLKDRYGSVGWEIKWSSQDDPYGPYDFEMLNDRDNIYIEVKSTTSKNMDRFFMSNNEYCFYSKNSKNYKLILISNIFESREDKTVSIQDFDNINIIISDRSGIEKNDNQWFFYTNINQLMWTR